MRGIRCNQFGLQTRFEPAFYISQLSRVRKGMTARNWDRVRRENLCRIRGSEGIGEDLPFPASEAIRPTGIRLFPDSAVDRSTTRESRTPIANLTNTGAKSLSQLTVLLQNLDSISGDAAVLKSCSDLELRDGRRICQLAIARLNEQMLKRQR